MHATVSRNESKQNVTERNAIDGLALMHVYINTFLYAYAKTKCAIILFDWLYGMISLSQYLENSSLQNVSSVESKFIARIPKGKTAPTLIYTRSASIHASYFETCHSILLTNPLSPTDDTQIILQITRTFVDAVRYHAMRCNRLLFIRFQRQNAKQRNRSQTSNICFFPLMSLFFVKC